MTLLIDLAARHHRPDDTRGLVRQRHSHQAHGLALQQGEQIRISRLRFALCVSHHGGHTNDEQLAKIAIAHLGDASEPFFATTRLLERGQPQPGCELPPGAELMRVSDRCCQRGRADCANARYRHEPRGKLALALPGQKVAFDLANLRMNIKRLLRQSPDYTDTFGWDIKRLAINDRVRRLQCPANALVATHT